VTHRVRAPVIAGIYEHPSRRIEHQSVAEIHAQVALGALADAGLTLRDVDGLFCDSSRPGLNSLTLSEYLGIGYAYTDNTDTGGSSYLSHVGHAAEAIRVGKCRVALCTMAGKAKAEGAVGARSTGPETPFEAPWGMSATLHNYALVAKRHMAEFGTTSAQLAEVKVAAAHHAQFNPRARLPEPVTVDDVLTSPMLSDPLHRLDCCVVTDGGGACVVVSADVAQGLERPRVSVRGHGEAVKHTDLGRVDLSYTAAVWSGPAAFHQAGVTPADIAYASIYDSFTITVLITLEDLGFCAKGEGGRFVESGALYAPDGAMPVNTDGGGLCNTHPANRGGMPKILEAVRQLRGEAAPQVQVRNCQLALVHGTGGRLGTRSGAATLILGGDDT
jgi:acetyl-CoA C-acetyltransferase